jgi:hypothetical protein
VTDFKRRNRDLRLILPWHPPPPLTASPCDAACEWFFSSLTYLLYHRFRCRRQRAPPLQLVTKKKKVCALPARLRTLTSDVEPHRGGAQHETGRWQTQGEQVTPCRPTYPHTPHAPFHTWAPDDERRRRHAATTVLHLRARTRGGADTDTDTGWDQEKKVRPRPLVYSH